MKKLLMRLLPARIVARLARKIVDLTESEVKAQLKYTSWLPHVPPQTDKLVLVAIVGLTGSGKSHMARLLARLIGAVVVCADDISVQLTNHGAGYDNTWLIAENSAAKTTANGRNVIIDSDFVDKNKRESLKILAKEIDATLIFIRTICDFDIMSQRIRENDPDNFFNFAKSTSKAKDHGKDVKFREMARRILLHYDWTAEGGGKLTPKNMHFLTYAPIDMGADNWEESVHLLAENIIADNKMD